jgi:hypothetical protein
MKVSVNRQLRGGEYFVSFKVGDFTPDELARMESFGVPGVLLTFIIASGQRVDRPIAINKISQNYLASFPTEEEARQYELRVLNDLRQAIAVIRQLKDGYTSSEEVDV